MKDAIIIEEHTWNKKRIAIGVAVVILLVVGAIYLKVSVLGADTEMVKRESVETAGLVRGAKTEEKSTSGESAGSSLSPLSKESIQEGFSDKLADIKEQVNNLDIKDIAESSPQYQKAVEDLQSLQSLPKNEAKKACLSICENL